MIFSLIHAISVGVALYTGIINRITFIGEAVCGFLLWNYIAYVMTVEFDVIVEGHSVMLDGAAIAPVFIIALITWWILVRYPNIKKTK